MEVKTGEANKSLQSKITAKIRKKLLKIDIKYSNLTYYWVFIWKVYLEMGFSHCCQCDTLTVTPLHPGQHFFLLRDLSCDSSRSVPTLYVTSDCLFSK